MQNLSKSTQITVQCQNSLCKRTFSRRKKLIQSTKGYYCSRSCAASVNNKLYPKRKFPDQTCAFCKNTFHNYGNSLYCSRPCKNKSQILSKEDVLQKINDFFEVNGRIPTKREFSHPHAAYDRFGTWNKAIKAAGFIPNRARFTKKYKAQDGHICDSFSEMIIDNWLYKRDIRHERSIPYGKNNMTADFKVNDTFIEFIGLRGVKKYEENLANKELFWKNNNLKVITIYPKDLYPENKLAEILPFT